MITFTKSFKTLDNKIFASLEEAQIHEIASALGYSAEEAKNILAKKDILLDILTTKPTSKTRARSINGGTKRRKVLITDANVNVIPSNVAPNTI